MDDAQNGGLADWKAFVALNTLKKRISTHSNSAAETQECSECFEDLSSYYYALIAETQISKAHILEPLSCLLLCLSSALSANNYNCPDANTISVSIIRTKIEVKLGFVQFLHELLFMQLSKQAKMILASVEDGTEIFGSNNTKSAAYHTELDDIFLWLRCCIRILPLLEFDTGISENATAVLASLFWSLCSPNLVCMALRSNQPNHGETEVVTSETSCWMCRSLSSTQTVEFKLKSRTSEYHCPGMKSLVSGMLEVFVDEFILHPSLGESFVNGDKESVGSFARFEKPLLCGKQMELSLEALFVHCLLSLCKSNLSDTFIHKLFDLHSGYNVNGRISLPAAVLLLDALVLYKAPQIFVAHGLVLVSKAVSIDSLPTYGEFPMELELPMHFSVFENAVKLYMKHSSVSNLSNDNEWLENPVLEFCLIKYGALQTDLNLFSDSVINLMWNEKDCLKRHYFCSSHRNSSDSPNGGHLSKLLKTLSLYITELKTTVDELCRDEISSVLHCLVKKAFLGAHKSDIQCYASRNVNSCSYLPAAILHLIGCSLSQIVHIAKEEGRSGHSALLNQPLLRDYDGYITHKLLHSFGHRSCMQPIGIALNNIMAKMLVRGNKSVAVVLSYFAGELFSEFQMGSELLCKGYISVMKSLMWLLVLENGGVDILRALLESSEFSMDQSDVNSKRDINQDNRLQSMSLEMAPPSSTLTLLKHLKKMQLHTLSDNTNQGASEDVATELSTNIVKTKSACMSNKFMQSILEIQGKSEDDFSDLTDFIVCKKERNYSVWLKKKHERRKREYKKGFFQRMKRRKELLAALSMDNMMSHI